MHQYVQHQHMQHYNRSNHVRTWCVAARNTILRIGIGTLHHYVLVNHRAPFTAILCAMQPKCFLRSPCVPNIHPSDAQKQNKMKTSTLTQTKRTPTKMASCEAKRGEAETHVDIMWPKHTLMSCDRNTRRLMSKTASFDQDPLVYSP
jgi:hypothetical protein